VILKFKVILNNDFSDIKDIKIKLYELLFNIINLFFIIKDFIIYIFNKLEVYILLLQILTFNKFIIYVSKNQ
jgi:hypothetical protein